MIEERRSATAFATSVAVMNNETSNRGEPPAASKGMEEPGKAVQLIRPLLLSLAAVGAIFGTFHLLERTWLDGFEMATIHAVHIGRGIFSSLVVALIFGHFILRSSPRLIVTRSAESEWMERPRLPEWEKITSYARWFIAMRWIAVLVAIILVFVTISLEWLSSYLWWPLLGCITLLATTNIAYGILIRRSWAARPVLALQAYVDLGILTGLLHFSGGVENPLSVVMIFHVIIGGIILSKSQSYGVAAAASLMFGLMIWAEWSGMWDHYTLKLFPHPPHSHGETMHAAQQSLFATTRLILQIGILFLTAYFVTTLSEHIRENEERLEALAERALAGHQLLEKSLDTTSAGLRVLGRDLQANWSSSRWNEWFRPKLEFQCPGCDLLDSESSPWRQCLQDGRVRVTEVTLDREVCPGKVSTKNPEKRVFQITTAPLLDLSLNITKVVELAQDITLQKQTQTQMIRAGKLAAIGELAGKVAHEVNNPISIISAKADLLLSDHRHEMPPKIAQEVGKIRDLAGRVARIAGGLLSYCRPSSGARIQLDLRGPIRKSLAMIEEHARREGVRIDDRLPGSLPPVRANSSELEQVFLNLFLNALDAMPKGGWLIVSARADSTALPDDKPCVTVIVEDTGKGISDSVRDHIFEPFFTTKQEGCGTGLGLSICQGLVQSHGGDIQLESREWQGTRVTITLPAANAADGEEPTYG